MKALIASELRQRVRGRRWWIVLVVWTVLLTGLVAAIRAASLEALEFSDLSDSVGPAMFGALALLVLALASLVVPALTATAINGERDRGTLAVLQATMLRPWEIVLAKFLAAWIASLAFLVVTIPLAGWAATEGGVGFGQALVVYAVLAILTGVLGALGLASSAVVTRPSLSTVTAYGLVFFMTVLLPVFFGIALATAPDEVTLRRGRVVATEKEPGWRWVLLAPDPFVILADAAPPSPNPDVLDLLGSIREVVRYARQPEGPDRGRDLAPLWPAGLAIDLGLGVAALGLATARLRVPARRLAVGQRVA